MNKKIKVKLVNLDQLKFELLEDANRGDFIIFNDSEDSESIREINHFLQQKNANEMEKKYREGFESFKSSNEFQELKQKNAEFSEKINGLNQKIELEKQKAVADYKNDHEYRELINHKINSEKKIELLNNQLGTIKSQTINEFKLGSEYKGLEKKIDYLSFELKNIQENFQSDLKKELTVYEGTKKNEITELKYALEKQFEIDKNNELTKLSAKHQEELRNKAEENKILLEDLDRHKNFRSIANSKLLGEELENWVYQQLADNYMNDFYRYYKDNDITQTGTKADFIVEINDPINIDKKISTITIECKSQSQLTGDSGKKSDDKSIINTLLRNAEKNKSRYAILVSNLEPEKQFSIRYYRHGREQYPNISIFIVRPDFLLIILKLIEHIELKRNQLEQKYSDINKMEVLDDLLIKFEVLKDEIINKEFTNLKKDCEDIIKHSNAITDNAEKIRNLANNKIAKHIEVIKNKFDRFNPIVKKINKNSVNLVNKDTQL